MSNLPRPCRRSLGTRYRGRPGRRARTDRVEWRRHVVDRARERQNFWDRARTTRAGEGGELSDGGVISADRDGGWTELGPLEATGAGGRPAGIRRPLLLRSFSPARPGLRRLG